MKYVISVAKAYKHRGKMQHRTAKKHWFVYFYDEEGKMYSEQVNWLQAAADHGGPDFSDRTCEALRSVPNPSPAVVELIQDRCSPCPNSSHLGFVFEGEITSISDPENLLGGVIAEGETWSTLYCLDANTPDTNPSTAFQYEIDFIAITIGGNDEFVCTEGQILQIEADATFGTYQVFCFGMTPPVLPPFTRSTFNIFLGTFNADLLDGSLPAFAHDLNDFDGSVVLNWNLGDRFPFGSQVTGTITSFVQV